MHAPRIKGSLLLVVVPALAFVLAVAGCGGGGGSSKPGSGDVATVGSIHVPQSTFNDLMAQAKQSFKSQKRTWPKVGSTDYQSIKSQAIDLLVQTAQREEKAKSLGIVVTDKDVQARLDKIKKQYFGGSEKKYQAQLKAQAVSQQLVLYDVKSQLVSEALYNKVTKSTTVSAADVHQYYVQHASTYSQPASRDVRHILVKSKTLAQSIYKQLLAGNDKTWCTLAKKYSQDPSSKNVCGKLTVQKGQTVPAFDKVAFAQPTNKVHAPVYDSVQYKSYFVIEPLSAIKPASTTPESKVADSIKQQLLSTKKTSVMNVWATDLAKSYCKGSKVTYQAGYQPSPDPCATLTSSTSTT